MGETLNFRAQLTELAKVRDEKYRLAKAAQREADSAQEAIYAPAVAVTLALTLLDDTFVAWPLSAGCWPAAARQHSSVLTNGRCTGWSRVSLRYATDAALEALDWGYGSSHGERDSIISTWKRRQLAAGFIVIKREAAEFLCKSFADLWRRQADPTQYATLSLGGNMPFVRGFDMKDGQATTWGVLVPENYHSYDDEHERRNHVWFMDSRDTAMSKALRLAHSLAKHQKLQPLDMEGRHSSPRGVNPAVLFAQPDTN